MFIRFGVLWLFILLSGCASTHYETYVNSLAAADAETKIKYVLISGDKNVSEEDLQYVEYSQYVRKILAQRGFTEAATVSAADLLIALNYSISSPQAYTYTYSAPTWGQTGVTSSSTVGTISPYGNSATYTGTTTYTPSYGITGSQTQTATEVLYARTIKLTAFDVATFVNTSLMKQVWVCQANSAGSSGDLRQVFPYMLASMKDYIAKNSGKKVRVDIEDDDPEVIFLRHL